MRDDISNQVADICQGYTMTIFKSSLFRVNKEVHTAMLCSGSLPVNTPGKGVPVLPSGKPT